MLLQPPIELLRQFMDMHGWYGRDNSFRSMTDVQFVSAMGPPGGGRSFVTDRYLRHYHILALSQVTATDTCLSKRAWGDIFGVLPMSCHSLACHSNLCMCLVLQHFVPRSLTYTSSWCRGLLHLLLQTGTASRLGPSQLPCLLLHR